MSYLATWTARITFVSLALFAFCGASPVFAQTILLDNFEEASLPIIFPPGTGCNDPFLWNQYTGDGQGCPSLSTVQHHDGLQSLRVNITAGWVYMEFIPHNASNLWQFMHEFIQPPSAWFQNHFNRMRFWIKVPPIVIQAQFNGGTAGQNNGYVGTYYRCQTCDPTSAESGGNHGYHSFNLPYTGEWHQFILDWHPDHIRTDPGGFESGTQQYPTTTGVGWNYFDAMTRFYVTIYNNSTPYSSYPDDFFFDGFELYYDANPENLDQIYSLNGVYVPSTNKLFVGWRRNKNEDTINHEVRYAFSDIFTLGFANATPAPNGIVAPSDVDGYNGMEWSSTAVTVTGQSKIYVAIKPQNSSLFRQIGIPISSAVAGTPPAPPINLQIR